jgi:DTW domain-containing protein
MRARNLQRCDACALPRALCLCGALPRLGVQTRVIVVTNRCEAIRSTNTGRLATLVLQGSCWYVNGAPGLAAFPAQSSQGCLVLFPFAGARALGEQDKGAASLLVPDGSWRQARRLAIRAVRDLGARPVTLPGAGAGLTAMRKSTAHDALCTFEAIARALSLLEGSWVGEQMMPVLRVFLERSRAVRDHGSDFAP